MTYIWTVKILHDIDEQIFKRIFNDNFQRAEEIRKEKIAEKQRMDMESRKTEYHNVSSKKKSIHKYFSNSRFIKIELCFFCALNKNIIIIWNCTKQSEIIFICLSVDYLNLKFKNIAFVSATIDI